VPLVSGLSGDPTTDDVRPAGASASAGAGDHYARIHAEIVGGKLPPGTVLIPAALSERFGVSRTPVREALIRLEHEGLVERATRGFLVRRRSPEDVLEICEARIALESSMARAAAARRTVLDLARLTHVHEQAAACTDPDEMRALNNAWHHALREAGHNRTIAELMDRLDAQLAVHDFRTPGLPDEHALIVAEHERILRAVRDGDGDAASAHMVEHQGRTRDSRIAALARHGL